jgi:hypothetical protein
MKYIRLKISIILLAIIFFSVSCGKSEDVDESEGTSSTRDQSPVEAPSSSNNVNTSLDNLDVDTPIKGISIMNPCMNKACKHLQDDEETEEETEEDWRYSLPPGK